MMKNNIVLLRKQNKITQEQLACEAGISRQALYAIEKNKNVPTVETAIRIAEFFGRSVEEIFRFDDEWIKADGNCDGELMTGQGLKKYEGLKYGNFAFSFNGGEIAAVYNAMLLSGHKVSLSATIEEFEINRMAVLGGLAGTDVKRLGEYFNGHGIEIEKFNEKTAFLNAVGEGTVVVFAYYENSVRRLIHTVGGKSTDGKNITLYNLSDTDEYSLTVNAEEFFSKRSFICGYVIK